MSFPKMTVSHAELCDATKDGPITVRLIGEPVKPKYPPKGKYSAVQNFQFNGRAYQYQIPNDAVCAVLEQHVGSMVTIQANGTNVDQSVEVEEVAAPAATLPPQQKPALNPEFKATSRDTCEHGRPLGEDCQGCAILRDKPESPAPAPRHGPKLRSITYGRTVNLGNYENFRLEVTIDLNDGDNSNEAMTTLQNAVDAKCASIKTKKQNATSH